MLYGTATIGGNFGVGAVYKINKAGTGYGAIFSFTGDGAGPRGKLEEGADGTLYGTTWEGGAGVNTNGTAFKLNKDG